MADLRWFPFDARNWLGSAAVTLMSPEQEGAYIRVLATMWDDGSREPYLPDDDVLLARVSRLGARWETEGGMIRAQFVVRNDRLYSPHLSELWGHQRTRYERRLRAGQKGNQSQGAMRNAMRSAKPATKHSHSASLSDPHSDTQRVREVEVEREVDSKRMHSSKELLHTQYLAPNGARAPREARAPGAGPSDNGAPPDASESGGAVEAAAAGGTVVERTVERPVETEPRGGTEPSTISEVLDLLRPGRNAGVETARGALARVDAAAEERQAIAFVEADPAVRARLIQTVSDEWGTRFKDDAHGDAMLERVWKSACVQAYRAHRDALPNEVTP